MRSTAVWMAIALAVVSSTALCQEVPKVDDARLQLELMAESPDIMTPTGVAVEASGRVLAIESHTHFPPKGYDGPKHDRILAFDPKDSKKKPTIYFEGSIHTMNLGVHPDGSVFVATRQKVFRLRDTNGDGKADQETEIAHLETTGNYPHNGLSGFAFNFEGDVFFGFGENLGADYKLIGTDGTTLSGGGEGGNVYQCKPDGSKLRKVATGFWNPFAMALDPLDRLFVVDNDPDSRPPCRLLHIVEQGDYGYKFRNGRKGVHPFTAWNGELPGTLPMVAGTGEAPSGIVSVDSDQWPADLRGTLIVTSWGDHRIECYPLKPRGASFGAERKVLVTGGENFRPAGMALAPDGSIWFSDWVDRSYELHKKGRLWRLSVKDACKPEVARRSQEIGRATNDELLAAVNSSDRIWREAALGRIGKEKAIRQAVWPKLVDAARNTNDLSVRVGIARMGLASDLERAFDAIKADVVGTPLDAIPDKSANDIGFVEWLAANAGRLIPPEERSIRGQLFGVAGSIAIHFGSNPKAERPEVDRLIAALWRVQPGGDTSYDRDLYPDITSFIASKPADPFLLHAVADRIRVLRDEDRRATNDRLVATVVGIRNHGGEKGMAKIPMWLADKNPDVRIAALQWVHDARLKQFEANVRESLKTATTRQLFEACLATLQMLSDKPYDPGKEARGEEEVAKLALDAGNSPELRAIALRMLRADHPAIKMSVLDDFIGGKDPVLALEGVRKLGERSEPDAAGRLEKLVSDDKASMSLRTEATATLSPDTPTGKMRLVTIATSDAKGREIMLDSALRQLRGKLTADEAKRITAAQPADRIRDRPALELVVAGSKPGDRPKADQIQIWLDILKGTKGDPERGRLVFFSRQARCSSCHESQGRGAAVGPNLTGIGKTMTLARLLDSILRPSAEVAPQFAPLRVTTNEGISKTGIYVGEEVDGKVNYVDAEGKRFQVHPRDLESREEVKQSIMPEQLVEGLTLVELNDLLSYLTDGT